MRLTSLAQALSLSTAAILLTACGSDSDSDTTPIIRDVTPPLLSTSSDFADRTTVVAASFISGKVQDTGGVQSLTYQVNDKPAQAITLDTDGKFDAVIHLGLGTNKITLVAKDIADNDTTSTKTLYLGDSIAAGGSHTGAIKEGRLYGWGRNNFSQTGLGKSSTLAENNTSVIPIHPDTPTLMNNAPKDLVSLSFNQNYSVAIAQDGQVYSWGDDKFGQLGRGSLGHDNCSRLCRFDIGAIGGINNALTVSAGYNHNLILTQDGTVWAMGSNSQGQLGDGTTNDSNTPVKVNFSSVADIGRIVQVAASSSSSYALDDKGQVWGWGSDSYANLGKGLACTVANNCLNKNPVPVRITVMTDTTTDEKITQLATGRDHVLALTNKESVYAWGLNASSQLGYYDGEDKNGAAINWEKTIITPTKLPWFTNKEVNRVYANGNSSYVVLDNGKVYPWGTFGETNSAGRTIYNDLDEPTDTLPSLTNIDNMAMGALHLIAKDGSENLYTWGWSFEGSIGSKIATNIWMYNVPFAISLPTQATVS